MIERESKQRLLKDRDEGLRQLLGQWTQTCAKTGCQDECLSDLVHEEKKMPNAQRPTLNVQRKILRISADLIMALSN